MTAAAVLLAELRARGVTLEPHGDALRVRPASRLEPDELERLRTHKAEVLALLRAPREERGHLEEEGKHCEHEEERKPPHAAAGLSYAHPWPNQIPGLGRRSIVAFTVCQDCAALPAPPIKVRLGPVAIEVPADRGTWTMYGDVALCLVHAKARDPRIAARETRHERR